ARVTEAVIPDDLVTVVDEPRDVERRRGGDIRALCVQGIDIRALCQGQGVEVEVERDARRAGWSEVRIAGPADPHPKVAGQRSLAAAPDFSGWDARWRHPTAVVGVALRNITNRVRGDGAGRCNHQLTIAPRPEVDALSGLNLRRRQASRVLWPGTLQEIGRVGRPERASIVGIGSSSWIKLRPACRQVVDDAVGNTV